MEVRVNQENAVLRAGKVQAVFHRGVLEELRVGETVLPCAGLSIDVGASGNWVGRSLAFQSFLDFNTWSLPQIAPTGESFPAEGKISGRVNDYLTFSYHLGPLQVEQMWQEDCGTIRMDTVVRNEGKEKLWINGTAFALRFATAAYEFDFPGNVPYGVFQAEKLEPLHPVETGLVTAVTYFSGSAGRINVIFIDPEEKWGTGVYREENRAVWTAVAGTELYLEPGEAYSCGSLYLQPLEEGEDRFAPIRRFYEEKGWRVPKDGVKDAVVYSGHPSGPWDANFPFRATMEEYAAYLKTITDMGCDTVWLLPIFDHREPADPERYLYAPVDQSVIDPRYGDDAMVRDYVEKAGEQGARVIFDYVPHGPRPQDPLGKQYFDRWASRKQDGSAQMEWTCLSFDMANPTYRTYMKDLVKDHIDRFGIGGTRIDCAMGGLSNWSPEAGNRPSSSNMKGGVAMANALREAFVEKGISPFVTPENFHPIPLYAGCTDAYYDMALYRTLYDLNHADLSPKAYVAELTRWLEHQMLSMPEGMNKLRFLGNHDTVSWVWDAKRPIAVYGVERAKAMWVLISLIDGCPLLYQGDEDPKIYLNETEPVLIDFFTELFNARKRWLSHAYKTRYEDTGTGLFACRRECGEEKRLVLVNLDETQRDYPVKNTVELLYGNAQVWGERVYLMPNTYALLRV